MAPAPVAPPPLASVQPSTPRAAGTSASAINPAFAKLALNEPAVASPTPSHLGKMSPPASPSPSSPSPASDGEDLSYEEAKRRAEERAEAALQCSIDNKDACLMVSALSNRFETLSYRS